MGLQAVLSTALSQIDINRNDDCHFSVNAIEIYAARRPHGATHDGTSGPMPWR